MKSGYFYDIECYPNYFTIGFLPINTNKDIVDSYCKADWQGRYDDKSEILKQLNIHRFTISGNNNLGTNRIALLNLKDFILNEVVVLVGFDNYRYDNLLIDYVLVKYLTLSKSNAIVEKIYDESYRIIDYKGFNYRKNSGYFKNYEIPYKSIDLARLHRLDKTRTSLKQVMIKLKWYRIQSLPIAVGTQIEKKDEAIIDDYNVNDLLGTQLLYINGKDELEQRLVASSFYGVDVTNSSRSNMADRILSKFYEDATGFDWWDYKNKRTERRIIAFKDLIDNNIKFKSEELSEFLREIRNTVINVGTIDNNKISKLKRNIIFKGTKYTFAKGGLHSNDNPGIFKSTDSYSLYDADVNSFYPKVIINLRLCPEHLIKTTFLFIVEFITNKRLETGDNILKIVINAIFGKMGDIYSWLYDLVPMYSTTINGQLLLLMLIEDLEYNNLHVISANTDGIITIVPNDRFSEYKYICDNWSKLHNFGLKFTEIIKYVRLNVNHYLVIKKDGSVKAKGRFLTEYGVSNEHDDEEVEAEDIDVSKGYKFPLVSKVLHDYYVNGKTVDESLYNNTDIYDFCISQRTGKDFINEYHTIKDSKLDIKILQKNVRYYVSKSGGVLFKRKKENNELTALISGKTVTIFNNYFEVSDFKEYNINYNFYKAEIYKIIYSVSNVIHKDIVGTRNGTKSGISGTLFDNIE
jgi:hypothetical protein